MPSWHCKRIKRAAEAPASALATSVLPTPASPSTSTRGSGDRLGIERLTAQRLFDRGGSQRHRAHVGQPDPRVLTDVPGLLDERTDRDHRPVLATAVELLVAELPALHRRDPDLGQHLV